MDEGLNVRVDASTLMYKQLASIGVYHVTV